MLVVGFDTATAAVSVALHDGKRVIAEAFAAGSRRHGELLMPLIAKVMADAGASRGDLTAVAVGVGPGPYTGLRVGVVTARVLGAVLGLPVHGVCSLDVIAASVAARGTPATGAPATGAPATGAPATGAPATGAPAAGGREFLVATDARRREVYWARYDAAGARLEGPLVGKASSIAGAAGLAVAGTGGQLYPEAFGEAAGPAFPDARMLCELVVRELGRQAWTPAPSPAAPLPPVPLSPVPLSPVPLSPVPLSPVPLPPVPLPPVPLSPVPLPPVPLLPAEPLYLRRPDAREPGPPKRVTPS